MTKADLVKRMAQHAAVTQSEAETVMNAFMSHIQEALRQGDTVTLAGFGTFAVRSRAGRKGRNPQTGRELFIPAKRTPKFRAGKRLREATQPPRTTERFAAVAADQA